MHKVLDGSQCQEDYIDDKLKHCLWHPDGDQGKRAEAGYNSSVKYLGAGVSDDSSKLKFFFQGLCKSLWLLQS